MMTLRQDISRSYPHLEKLFRWKLGIETAPTSVLADEVRVLTKDSRGKGVSLEKKTTLAALLRYIGDEILKNGAPDSWVHSVLDEAIYPVSATSRPTSYLCTENDIFYVPDPTEKLSKVFQAEVPLLDLSFEQIEQIKPLLGLAGNRIRYLESCVKERVIVSDDVNVDLQDSSRIRRKAKYLERSEIYPPSMMIYLLDHADSYCQGRKGLPT
jgi:hypothetical protein